MGRLRDTASPDLGVARGFERLGQPIPHDHLRDEPAIPALRNALVSSAQVVVLDHVPTSWAADCEDADCAIPAPTAPNIATATSTNYLHDHLLHLRGRPQGGTLGLSEPASILRLRRSGGPPSSEPPAAHPRQPAFRSHSFSESVTQKAPAVEEYSSVSNASGWDLGADREPDHWPELPADRGRGAKGGPA